RREVYVPLVRLARSMERFAGGETGERVPPAGAAELRNAGARFNEMAETISEQRRNRTAFVAGVAHDLRNPIAALQTGLQLAKRRGAATPEVEVALRQVQRLNRMVADLVDVQRIEAGSLALELSRVDLCDVARESVELFAPTTPNHEI